MSTKIFSKEEIVEYIAKMVIAGIVPEHVQHKPATAFYTYSNGAMASYNVNYTDKEIFDFIKKYQNYPDNAKFQFKNNFNLSDGAIATWSDSNEIVKVYRYEDSLEDIVKTEGPNIFLAGPTVRGNQTHLLSWRYAALEEIERQLRAKSLSNRYGKTIPYNIIVPEFNSRFESDKDKEWIPIWEYAGLCASDCIMFWIPRTKELIGLTTNHEFGYWMSNSRKKVIYGRPDDSYRNGYLDIMWKMTGTEQKESTLINKTLEQTIESSIFCALSNCYDFEKKYRTGDVYVNSPYKQFRTKK